MEEISSTFDPFPSAPEGVVRWFDPCHLPPSVRVIASAGKVCAPHLREKPTFYYEQLSELEINYSRLRY